MNTINHSSNASPRKKFTQYIHRFAVYGILVFCGIAIGVLTLSYLNKQDEKQRLKAAQDEMQQLFRKFSAEAELQLTRLPPMFDTLSEEIEATKKAESPTDFKIGAYKAQHKRIMNILKQIDVLLEKMSTDAVQIIEKHKVTKPQIIANEQIEKLAELRRLWQEAYNNAQLLQVQIEMAEYYKNQLELAEARAANKALLEEAKRIAQQTESATKQQLELLKKTENDIIQITKLEAEKSAAQARCDLLKTALQLTARQQEQPVYYPQPVYPYPVCYPYPAWDDPFYRNYNAPLVIGRSWSSKVIGDRLGGSPTITPAYRLYPATFPPRYYW